MGYDGKGQHPISSAEELKNLKSIEANRKIFSVLKDEISNDQSQIIYAKRGALSNKNGKNTNRNNRMRWDGKIARCKDESSLKKN